jgi:catechol 2,3-dioxygenase-like lactoylglutathione lyase family enzyme
MIILYVRNPRESVEFYSGILNHSPVEVHPNFAMLPLAKEMMLGLWAISDVAPTAAISTPSGELGITVTDRAAVLETYKNWQGLSVIMIQEPSEMDFGFTFTATDPDGHRIRVIAMRGENGAIP